MSAARPVLRDAAAQAQFQRDGLVRVPLLEPGELAALLAELAELRPADGFRPDGSGFAGNTYHCSFLDLSASYKRAAQDCLTRHFAAGIERHLVDYRVLTANFYVKPPGQGDLLMHQNWPVLDLNATSVTLWCPLVATSVVNGTLHYWPGSHKLVPHIEGPGSPAYFAGMLAAVREHLVPLELPAGEAAIFDDSLIHGSPPNLSGAPRIAVQLICIPREMKPIFYYRHSEDRFETVAADSDFYVEHSLDQLLTRQPQWQSLGFVRNRNRQIGEEEFLALLDKADAIREQGFEMSDTPPSPQAEPLAAATPLAQARRWVGRNTPRPIKLAYRWLRGRPLGDGPELSKPIRDVRVPEATHDTAQVRAYYEEMTPAYLAGFGEIFQGSRPESTDELIAYLIDALDLKDGMTLLDAGCGIGGPAMAIAARRNVSVSGLTLAQAQVDTGAKLIAERGLTDRVALQQGDFHKLADHYPAESFDRVLFLESICHAENYREVLSGAYRVLKPGGALYIKDFYCVDNRARPSMAAGQAADLEKLHSVYKLQLSDLASLVDLLSSLGFVIRFMRMPEYEPTYTHWAQYEHLAGRGWHPQSAEPGDIIQAVEFFCWKR